jgi:hypothetical protein
MKKFFKKIEKVSTEGKKLEKIIRTEEKKIEQKIKNMKKDMKEIIQVINIKQVNQLHSIINKANKNNIKNNNENKKEAEEDYHNERYREIINNESIESEKWGICPITQNYMKNPVFTPSGIYYEKEAILNYIQNNHCDPSTKQKLTPDMLEEDDEYKRAIQEYLQKLQ